MCRDCQALSPDNTQIIILPSIIREEYGKTYFFKNSV